MTEDFRSLTDVCQAIVKRGTQSLPTTERAYYAHCLFTKASLHALSISSLCNSSLERGGHLDIGAICILTRCIIEVCNATSYLLERNITKDEAHLRLHLVGLNHSSDLLRVNIGLGTSTDDFWSEHSIAYARQQLEGNPIFIAMDDKQKKYLLRGKSPFQHSRFRGKRPLSIEYESALYTLLSHSAHAFGLGLHGFAGYGSSTAAGSTNTFLIAIDTAKIYLSYTAITYSKFRCKALGKLPVNESDMLEQGAGSVALLKLLQEIRAGVQR